MSIKYHNEKKSKMNEEILNTNNIIKRNAKSADLAVKNIKIHLIKIKERFSN